MSGVRDLEGHLPSTLSESPSVRGSGALTGGRWLNKLEVPAVSGPVRALEPAAVLLSSSILHCPLPIESGLPESRAARLWIRGLDVGQAQGPFVDSRFRVKFKNALLAECGVVPIVPAAQEAEVGVFEASSGNIVRPLLKSEKSRVSLFQNRFSFQV